MKKVISIAEVKEDLSLGYQNWALVHDFLLKNKGKKIKITLDEKQEVVSQEKRNYFEGALLPAFLHFINKERAELNFKPYTKEILREIVKKEFNGRMVVLTNGKTTKVPQSTTELSNRKFAEFLDRLTTYMYDNGIPVPDPDEYKRWVDSVPEIGENYMRDIWLPLYDKDYIESAAKKSLLTDN